MVVRLIKKSGHKFFEFSDDGVSRVVCVDGWINPNICPGFCKPILVDTWESLRDSHVLDVLTSSDTYTVVCPTCFGYISSRGSYRKAGPYHANLVLDKIGLHQFLYNYTIL